jgi:hypothetical protein
MDEDEEGLLMECDVLVDLGLNMLPLHNYLLKI